MKKERLLLTAYWSVVGLFVLVFVWWIYFFSTQGALLVERITEAGVELAPDEVEAVESAANSSLRMLLYEGGFLGLLLLAGVILAFRAMRSEVRLHQQQRDLVSSVTHELRSPIASARLYIESLQLGRVPEEKRERYLKNAKIDMERLGAMVDRLLESARMTDGRPELTLQRLDLAEYVNNSVGQIVEQESPNRIEFEIDAPKAVLVEADAGALDTILRNLVANAVKYGGDDPRLRVSVREKNHHAVLEVRDYGPGIRDIEVKKAFQPFTRGGEAQHRGRPGVGLGLYLVNQLTKALGGRLRADNVEDGGGGFAVRIRLPLAPVEVQA